MGVLRETSGKSKELLKEHHYSVCINAYEK